MMAEKKREDFLSCLIFRAMEEKDLPEIEKIESETFKDPWPYEALKYELKENPFCHSFSLENKGKIAGYAFLHIHDCFSHLVNIAVEKNFRGRGVGEYLLKEVIKRAKINGAVNMVLEVREGNVPAINLYMKFGFKIERKQKKYYHNGEDALIMSLEIGSK